MVGNLYKKGIVLVKKYMKTCLITLMIPSPRFNFPVFKYEV